MWHTGLGEESVQMVLSPVRIRGRHVRFITRLAPDGERGRYRNGSTICSSESTSVLLLLVAAGCFPGVKPGAGAVQNLINPYG
jgi:hypothetical protein